MPVSRAVAAGMSALQLQGVSLARDTPPLSTLAKMVHPLKGQLRFSGEASRRRTSDVMDCRVQGGPVCARCRDGTCYASQCLTDL